MKGDKIDRKVEITIKGEYGKPGAEISYKFFESGKEVDVLGLTQTQFTALALMGIAHDLFGMVNDKLVMDEIEYERIQDK